MEVSRAELKIASAAKTFGFDFREKIVLDIGSSTGGFTEYALKNGASKVVAVEKGTNQMRATLRFNPKVELHEKTNIFDVVSEAHRGKVDSSRKIIVSTPDVILADVSFVSLKKVLQYAKLWLADESTEFLVMLKPQFEAEPEQLNRGVVKNENMRREIIRKFESWLLKNGFVVRKKKDSLVHGRHGNIERFYDIIIE